MTGKADRYQYHFRYKKGCEEEHYHLTASIGKLQVRAIEKAASSISDVDNDDDEDL